MKFYQKRGFALVVLVLAILGSCVYGISKKPAASCRRYPTATGCGTTPIC